MKVRMEVRWTINKESLPGLLEKRKGKMKEMLRTKVRWGSMKRAGVSRVMVAICKHVYLWC